MQGCQYASLSSNRSALSWHFGDQEGDGEIIHYPTGTWYGRHRYHPRVTSSSLNGSSENELRGLYGVRST